MTETPPRYKLVVLEESTLASLAGNATFTKEFPFLRSLKTVPKANCNTCGATNVQRATAYTSAKAAIAGMGQENKRKLKRLLNAKHVRVVYLTPTGKQVQLTF